MKRLLLILAVVPFLLGARVQPPVSPQNPPAPGFRTEFLAGLDDVGSKLIDLAESVPAHKFDWRPAPDVRSISEVFTHVAGSNYFLLTFVGHTPPPDLPVDIERI
ncbi:MAG TPA: DinB family protein, partial [Thermoanaerobaculia bacterium]|nr:DinB family protein [Thermoanaerobaculia bacterium]